MAEVNIYAKALGENIAARRSAAGYTQRGFAAKLNIQQATMHKIELGQRIPTSEQAAEISKEFNYELTELHLLFPQKYPAPEFVAPAKEQEEAA